MLNQMPEIILLVWNIATNKEFSKTSPQAYWIFIKTFQNSLLLNKKASSAQISKS